MQTERFKIEKGSRADITEALMKTFSLKRSEAETVTLFLIQNKEMLSKEEVISEDTPEDHRTGRAEFITDQMTWYINIKKTTVCFALFLLDLKDGLELEKLIRAAVEFGINAKWIVDLTKERGSKCLVMELARNRKKGMSRKEILERYSGTGRWGKECFNNHYQGCYNVEGYCEMNDSRIGEILGFLEEREIVKVRWGRYYYQM